MFHLFWVEDRDIQQASEVAAQMGVLNNSITEGEGNIAGTIGELKLIEYLGAENAIIHRTYDYDVIYMNTFKIDVKTKRTTVPFVEESYDASIANFNTEQDCDYYVFVRVNMEKRIGWLLGCVSPKLYYSKSRFLKKGQVDGSNNFVVKADCWNVRYGDLFPIEALKLWALPP